MKKKIIITESQFSRLQTKLNETTAHSYMVKEMKADLDKNYTPIKKYMREGGEYFERPMIQVNADKEVISPKSLYDYLKYKYKMGEEFTKQVIRDWVSGKITDEYMLSKTVSMK
jgi:hypothetical protein